MIQAKTLFDKHMELQAAKRVHESLQKEYDMLLDLIEGDEEEEYHRMLRAGYGAFS